MANDRPMIVLLVLAIVSMTITLAPTSDADSVDQTVTIYGYVTNLSDDETNVPFNDVTVYLLSSSSEQLDVSTTDMDGKFSFTYSAESSATYLRFEHEGYTVRSFPGSMVSVNMWENTAKFSIQGIKPDAGGAYCLSGTGSSTSAVGMALTVGTLFGTVTGLDDERKFPVEGARIVATSPNNQTFVTYTNPDGSFHMSIPYGTYTLDVSCDGFHPAEPMDVRTSNVRAISIYLEEKDFGIGILGGMNAPHALLIIGIVLITSFVSILYLVTRFSSGEKHKVVVVNDLAELDNSEPRDQHP